MARMVHKFRGRQRDLCQAVKDLMQRCINDTFAHPGNEVTPSGPALTAVNELLNLMVSNLAETRLR
jgi:hypothetical protein